VLGEDAPPAVLIGRPKTDHVAVWVVNRMHQGATDYWDGNWLVTPIEVAAGGFKGRVTAALRAEELAAFLEALKRMSDSLEGEATLESLETWLSLRVSIARSGHLEVHGTLTDAPGIGNRLTFDIADLDQTDLPAMIRSLSEAVRRFPVLGEP
jgi:hypothetical protein